MICGAALGHAGALPGASADGTVSPLKPRIFTAGSATDGESAAAGGAHAPANTHISQVNLITRWYTRALHGTSGRRADRLAVAQPAPLFDVAPGGGGDRGRGPPRRDRSDRLRAGDRARHAPHALPRRRGGPVRP